MTGENAGKGPPPASDLLNQACTLAETLPHHVNNSAPLALRGRYATFSMMIEIESVPYYVSVLDGRITQMERGPLVMRSWAFAIRGPASAWMTFWEPLPPPHFHDIFALAKRGEFRIEGDMRPLLTHLLFVKEMLAAPRRLSPEKA